MYLLVQVQNYHISQALLVVSSARLYVPIFLLYLNDSNLQQCSECAGVPAKSTYCVLHYNRSGVLFGKILS